MPSIRLQVRCRYSLVIATYLLSADTPIPVPNRDRMSACSVSNEDTANSNSHNHSVIILSSFDFHFPVSLYRGLLCSVHGEVVSALCEFDS